MRIDMVVQHRSFSADPDVEREDPLRPMCASLVVGSNVELTTPKEPEHIFGLVNGAEDARRDGRSQDAASLASEAVEAARSYHVATWLWEGRIVAAVLRALARALLIRGASLDDVSGIARAEEVLLRLMRSEGSGPALVGIEDDLRLVRDVLLERAPMPEWADPDRGRLDTRIPRGDLFLSISQARAVSDVGPATMAAAAAVAALSPVVPVASQAERPALLSRLLLAFQTLAQLSPLIGELGPGVTAGREMLALARDLVSSAPPERDSDAKGSLALALATYAQQLARINDTTSLTYAAQLLGQLEREGLLKQPPRELRPRESSELSGVIAWVNLVSSRVLHQQGDLEKALIRLNTAQQALSELPSPDPSLAGALRGQKARLLLGLGKPDEARRVVLENIAMKPSLAPIAAMGRAEDLLTAAEASEAMGDGRGAQSYAVEALRLALPVNWTSSAVHEAMDLASRTELPEDLRIDLCIARAAVVDSQEASVLRPTDAVDVREAFVRRDAYERLFDELMRARLVLPALLTADRGRARALRPLTQPTLWASNLAPAELRGSPMDALRAAASWLIEAGNTTLAGHGAPLPLQLEELPEVLAMLDGPVLVLQPVGNRLALVLLRGTELPPAVGSSPVPLTEIRQALEDVQGALTLAPRGLRASAPKLDEGLALLHAALVAPIARFLEPGRTLYVSPFRELLFVPFPLLGAAPDAPMLIENHAIALVPSLAWLRDVRKRRPWTPGEPLAAFVLGDPQLSEADRRALPPLAGAHQEAVDVASVWCAARCGSPLEPALGPQATEEAFRKGVAGCRLVHLACHGQAFDPAMASRLYLTPSPPLSDGYLAAYELAAFDLDDPLVFMSACETGLGRATTDGVLGLSSAFLAAGARAVIASLWRISDAATQALVGHFYRALFSSRVHAAQALRTAMLATRSDLAAGTIRERDGRQPDPGPRSWAPFYIIGDPTSVRIEGPEPSPQRSEAARRAHRPPQRRAGDGLGS
jgi:CHAT domain-containing protein